MKGWVFYKAEDYLNQVWELHGFTSDYQLAKHWNVDPSRISKYRSGNSTFDTGMCRRIERELKLPRGTVVAWVMAEREHDPELKDYWRDIQKALFSKAAVLAAFTVIGSALLAGAPESIDITHGIAQHVSQVADSNIHYAHFAAAAKTVLCGILLALFARWTRTCSARSG